MSVRVYAKPQRMMTTLSARFKFRLNMTSRHEISIKKIVLPFTEIKTRFSEKNMWRFTTMWSMLAAMWRSSQACTSLASVSIKIPRRFIKRLKAILFHRISAAYWYCCHPSLSDAGARRLRRRRRFRRRISFLYCYFPHCLFQRGKFSSTFFLFVNKLTRPTQLMRCKLIVPIKCTHCKSRDTRWHQVKLIVVFCKLNNFYCEIQAIFFTIFE